MPVVNWTNNDIIKNQLRNRGLLSKSNIAFAFDEIDDTFATLPHTFWESVAIFDNQTQQWTLNGSKNGILNQDFYEKYIIFCRNKNDTKHSIAAFLVDRDQLQFENDGTDNYGNHYHKIKFENLVLSRDEHELYTIPTSDSTQVSLLALNAKAHGQLMTAATILGMMKQILVNMSKMNEDFDTLWNERLCRANELIFTLESMIYQTSSHFDTFDCNCTDLFLQSMICKTIASESAQELLNISRIQFDSYRLPKLISTEMENVLNVLNSFLDSTTSNRMLLSAYAMQSIGSWQYDHIAKTRLTSIYFQHFLKMSIFPKYRKQTLNRFESSMDGFLILDKLNPELKPMCKHFREVLEIQKEMGLHILSIYGKDCIKNQIDMNRFASITMSAFKIVSVLSRVSQSLKQRKDAMSTKLELQMGRSICQQEAINVADLKDLIVGVEDVSEEKRSKKLHKLNIKFEGYFPKPTFDRII
ncbi:hypothetical protein RDWZM_000038 [Blomia tropicalis]|uniref:ACAD9/ACADV-like C-terminal domain-containing protein n=1 Tax=Blomia tropicalis TaxID=40697 RepID=A0A9Q0M7V0_BLOTA|nr:hypothetical protein RDWZM_000038 [Blomia tropicalis]